MIKKFKDILNEKLNDNEINDFISNIIINDVPTNQILNFKEDLKNITNEINESYNKKIYNLKYKYRNWLNDKLFKYLINRKRNFYNELKDKLNIFDLKTLDDIYDKFPGFKIRSFYLAGGMDNAPGTGKGWRNTLENEFELNTGKQNQRVDSTIVNNKKINPSHVVDSYYLDEFIKNPIKIYNLYEKPLLLNPVRKEIDRIKDNNFDKMIKKLKKPDYDPIKDYKPFYWFRNTFSKNIEPDDENLLRISDAVFLGQDNYAGAGTYGELELLSLMRKPLFVWLVNTESNNISAIKLWTIPHVCKIARNEKEMKILVKTILKYVKKNK